MSTFEELQKIIIDKLGVDEDGVTPEASFKNDLGTDSLDVLDMIWDAELKFNISIPDEKAFNVVTVSDAVKLIDSIK
jgi:acyl carrier protein